MVMIDTPDGIAFAKAAARKGALAIEIETGLRKRGQTAYSIVKEVYGFRGSRESVLADLAEYLDAELRIKAMPDEGYALVKQVTQQVIDHLGDDITQQSFEQFIYDGEVKGAFSHAVRQGASDLFYVLIVRQHAGYR
jgi:hypothetical protein